MKLMTCTPRENFEVMGVVAATEVRSKNAFQDIGAGFRNLVGGRSESYSRLSDETRQHAFAKLKQKAVNAGADAVIEIRMATNSIGQGFSELTVYGTAVKFV